MNGKLELRLVRLKNMEIIPNFVIMISGNIELLIEAAIRTFQKIEAYKDFALNIRITPMVYNNTWVRMGRKEARKFKKKWKRYIK